jgi:hypothetical protein
MEDISTRDLPDTEDADSDVELSEGSHVLINGDRLIDRKPQVIPLLQSSPEEVDWYSIYAAQHSVKRKILIKRYPYDMAFALTDFKLQGRTLPKLILSVCKRTECPWMTLQSFYVLISRVPSISNIWLKVAPI